MTKEKLSIELISTYLSLSVDYIKGIQKDLEKEPFIDKFILRLDT